MRDGSRNSRSKRFGNSDDIGVNPSRPVLIEARIVFIALEGHDSARRAASAGVTFLLRLSALRSSVHLAIARTFADRIRQ